MRVRYEMYKNGSGRGAVAECDLTPARARKKFDELCELGRCGWAELVAEDADEGGYMEILESFDHIKNAQFISAIVSALS